MVNKRRVKPQSKYFYSPRWTKRHNNAFINSLAWQGSCGRKQNNPENVDVYGIEFAMGVVNGFSPVTFNYDFFEAKLEFLRKRFTTFRRILTDMDFYWNANSNRVLVSKEAWDRPIIMLPYWWRGEANFELLRTIFQADNRYEATVANATNFPLALTDGNEVSSGEEGDVVFLGVNHNKVGGEEENKYLINVLMYGLGYMLGVTDL
ncbi:hypothetical protein Salat_0648500 [Sesamum alatum]|uniref:Myb/SANT-like domain-containing protein n=1 Tax=Sesamum alatum TaxID=300844 RepID=A0AAE2CUA3_9LAMI|nr:hypothetical protein Salat_0648500 [Sesamum alatum]